MQETKRRVIAQRIVCQGGCSGATGEKSSGSASRMAERGGAQTRSPEIHAALNQRMCGPLQCSQGSGGELGSGSQWLENITDFNQYRSLVQWAVR
jgi:hypothetical protein